MRKYIIRKKAKHDIDSATKWYDDERDGLGDEFIDEVERTVSFMSQFPNMFPKVEFGLHKAQVRRFPYTIYYYHKNERISIIACLHSSRDRKKIIEERN